MAGNKLGQNMRIVHRYLGFFLAGIMAVYAFSGIIMIFRNTDFLKKEIVTEMIVDKGLSASTLGSQLNTRIRVQKTVGDTIYVNKGVYSISTGAAIITEKKLPYVIDKMEKLHKATTNSPLFFLNIFFGVALLFFVISAFWMFIPSSSVFKKGMYFTLAGIILTLVLVFI